jgi:tetratricopeptide (TPR) repeat protein
MLEMRWLCAALRPLAPALLAAVLALGVTATATSAGATDEAPAGANERALELSRKSATSYREGRFQEAVTLLEQAYALKPEPVLLYNMGRAYEGLGDLKSAVKSYSDYLAAQPNARDRGALEQRIATMQKQIDEREKLEREHQTASVRPQPDEKRPPVVPWIVAGVGGAGLATGAVFGVLALSTHSAANSDPVQASAAQKQSDAQTFATVATVGMIAGGVVAAGGILWGLLASRSPAPAPTQGAGKPTFLPIVAFGHGGGFAGIEAQLP